MSQFNESQVQIRRRIRLKNRKHKKSKHELQIQNKFGLTVNQVDILISELCQQYKCQWLIVSRELLRQHGITICENAIRQRYSAYLDPNIKEWYTPQEERQLARLFWIQGKNYAEINSILGNHGRGSIRQSLCYSARTAFSRLARYAHNCVRHRQRSEQQAIDRRHLLSTIISRSSVNWQQFKYTYRVFYFFVCHDGQQLNIIPRQLAYIVYQRLTDRGIKHFKDRESCLSRIVPNLMQQNLEKAKAKQRRYLNKYRKNSMKLESDELIILKRQQLQQNEMESQFQGISADGNIIESLGQQQVFPQVSDLDFQESYQQDFFLDQVRNSQLNISQDD